MPSYKLKYFNARGFGEVPRLLFALAGQKYEDIRFTRETWPEVKPTTPFGQAPVLEIDGKQYGQSGAISRYLARTFGYYGETDLEVLEIEQVMGIMQDVIGTMIKMHYEEDEERKKKFMKEAKEEKLPMYLNMLQKILTNNGSTGYFVGKKISLADVMVFDMGEKIKDFVNYDDYPLVKKSREMVGANPKIKAWVESRPKTDN